VAKIFDCMDGAVEYRIELKEELCGEYMSGV